MKGSDEVVVIGTNHGRVTKNTNSGGLLHQLRQFPGSFKQVDAVVIFSRTIVKKPAQPGAGFQQDDAQPALARGQSRRHTRRPAADHTYIRLGIDFIIFTLHLKFRRNFPKPGGLAHLLQSNRPYFGRLVHHTIVKSGGHGPIQPVHESHHVFFRGSFYILGFYRHPVAEKRIFRTNIGDAVYLHTGITAFAVQAV